MARSNITPSEPAVTPQILWVPANGNRTWEEAVAVGKYDQVLSPGFNPVAELLPFPEGIQDPVKACLLPPRVDLKTQQPEGLTPEKWLESERFIHPLTFLAIAENYPEEQLLCPLLLIWRSPTGKLWIATQSGYKGKRHLTVVDVLPSKGIGDLEKWGASSRPVVYKMVK